MVKNLSFIISFFIINSCAPRIYDKDKLVNRVSLEEMRKDGYYYRVSINNDGIINIFPIVFFENGYVKSYVFINSVQKSIHSKLYENKCDDLDHQNNIESALRKTDCFLRYYLFFEHEKNLNPQINNNSIDGWGKYYLFNNKLIIRYYYNYKGNYYLSEDEGNIIDSWQFNIRKSTLLHNGKDEKVDEIYYFRELDHINDYPNKIKTIN